MEKVKVAVAGVGNSIAYLLKTLSLKEEPKGIWHQKVGGMEVKDIEIVAAFDIDERKIGKPLNEAALTEPNVVNLNDIIVGKDVMVQRGILLDEISYFARDKLRVTKKETPKNISKVLEDSGAEVLLLTISSGLQKTSEAYAEQALNAGVSLINATPSTIASNLAIVKKFEEAKLIVVGDDLMSQFGGTALHRGILNFMKLRGISAVKSYQVDVGGGLESLNTMDEGLKELKKNIKTRAIVSEVGDSYEVVTGTTDYVEFMKNRRVSHFWFEAEGLLGKKYTIDLLLTTEDAPNATNILLDVIRAVKHSMKKGEYGAVDEICNFGFKKTLNQESIELAVKEFEKKYCF
ncbi:MAG: L-myo-inositol-1-phosphate synthase [Thermoproteota archaeon]|nr:L-myo-inositol-1-phosphate synthase [Candidatus Brockarchaeota archaeon]